MNSFSVELVDTGVAVVTLRGEHEAYNAERLHEELATLGEEKLAIVIDLSETSFIDSAIVSVLLRARDSARDLGVPLVLVIQETTGWAVRRLFDVAHLDEAFAIVESRGEAVEAAQR